MRLGSLPGANLGKMRNVKPRTPCSRGGAAPLQQYPTRPLYGYLAIFSSLVLDISSHRPDAWVLLRYRYQIIPLRNVHSESSCMRYRRFLPASMSGAFRGTAYITWSITETSKLTIGLRAIFQSLRCLPLVENVYHNFNLPPCATPGSRARHERGQ